MPMDRLTDEVRGESLWRMFAGDIVIYSYIREQMEKQKTKKPGEVEVCAGNKRN